MNKKGQVTFAVTLGIVIAIIVGVLLLFGGALVFIGLNKFQLAGITIAVLGFIFAVKPSLTGTHSLDNKKIALIMMIFLVSGIFFFSPYLGLVSNVQLSSSFTPIYCNDYSFTCCIEKTVLNTISTMSASSSYKCPSNANSCTLKSTTDNNGKLSYLYYGKNNCMSGFHPLACLGTCFLCDDSQVLNLGNTFNPDSYIFTSGTYKYNTQLEIKTNQLIFTGRSGSTVGVPVPGADGCSFNPSATYDSSGNLVKVDKTGTSYVSHTDECILTWNEGDRHVCGNFEEKCSSDIDCNGHTYGNYECYAKTLQRYGCKQLTKQASGVQQVSGDYVFFNTESNSGNFGNIASSRCEVLETKSTGIECCGDTDCGSNAFCDNNPNSATAWKCKPKGTVQCTQNSDCGTSQQCDINTKQIKSPICKSNKCDFNIISTIECCTTTDCPNGQFCGSDNKCKQSANPKTDCPDECCVGLSNHFDKPCADGLFCINGLCSNKGCVKDSDCSGGKICKNGNCIDKEELVCTWYQEQYSTSSIDYGLLGWRKMFGNAIVKESAGCKTASWVISVIAGVFMTLFVIVIVLLLKNPKKGRKKKRK